MLEGIFFLIAVAVVLQPSMNRAYTALFYYVPTLMHHLLTSKAPALIYYGSGAIADSVAVLLLYKFAHPCPLRFNLAFICTVSISLNFIGWGMFMAYLEPDVYNMAFIIVYAWVLVVMLGSSKADGNSSYRSTSLGGRRSGIRPFNNSLHDSNDGNTK